MASREKRQPSGYAGGEGPGGNGRSSAGADRPVVMPVSSPNILVVDDEPEVGRTVCALLETSGYAPDWAGNAFEAARMMTEGRYELVVCDVRMPGEDGLTFLKKIVESGDGAAVVMITGSTDLNLAVQALKSGAYDYLVKPFDAEQLVCAVEKALEKRSVEVENRYYRRDLETKVAERTRQLLEKHHELSNLVLNSIGALVSTLEARDTYTEGHSWKVATLAAGLGRLLGFDSCQVEDLSLAGLLHDIGKIGIRDSILNKPSKLTDEEYARIREHPVIGERILAPLEPIQRLLPCVRHHHEWFNGSGYPDGLAGDNIPGPARVLSIADVYDAITSNRSYRPARSREEALSVIEQSSGTQFDPEMVAAFLRMRID